MDDHSPFPGRRFQTSTRSLRRGGIGIRDQADNNAIYRVASKYRENLSVDAAGQNSKAQSGDSDNNSSTIIKVESPPGSPPRRRSNFVIIRDSIPTKPKATINADGSAGFKQSRVILQAEKPSQKNLAISRPSLAKKVNNKSPD